MYSADKARGDCLDRPANLKNGGFSEAVCANIDLGRTRMLVDGPPSLRFGRVHPAHLNLVVDAPWSGPDFQGSKWWEQSRMNWQERVVVVAGGTEIDPKELSDADLEARRRQLRKHPR